MMTASDVWLARGCVNRPDGRVRVYFVRGGDYRFMTTEAEMSDEMSVVCREEIERTLGGGVDWASYDSRLAVCEALGGCGGY
jgi:hypothetical protein